MLSPGSTYTEEFAAVAESVPRARAAVTGFAVAAGAHEHRLEAIRLAASEAVTNAVLHAELAPNQTFRVSATYVPSELWVLVEDDGVGMQAGSDRGGLGVGLVLIAQLADSFEIVRRSSGGTQLQMRFRMRVSGAGAEDIPRRSAALSPA